MATAEGSVVFEAMGKSRSLRFTTNALCMLEDKTGLSTLAIGTEIQFGVSMATLRAMFWAGCGDKDLLLAEAGDLIDDLGIRKAREIATEAFAAAFPEAEAGESADADPKTAAAG